MVCSSGIHIAAVMALFVFFPSILIILFKGREIFNNINMVKFVAGFFLLILKQLETMKKTVPASVALAL